MFKLFCIPELDWTQNCVRSQEYKCDLSWIEHEVKCDLVPWFATPAFPLRDLFHVRRHPTSAPSAEFDLFGGSSASFNTLATSLSIVTGTAVFPWRRNLGMRVQAGFLAGMMIMSVG